MKRSMKSGRSPARSRIGGKSIEEVLAETTLGDSLVQISICRRNHPTIDRNRAIPTDADNRLLLQDAEQLDLHLRRNFSDLIKKQRSTTQQFEFTKPSLAAGTGEGSLHITEQFAFDQVAGQSRTVDSEKRAITEGTGVMDRLSEDLFSGSRFADDQ